MNRLKSLLGSSLLLALPVALVFSYLFFSRFFDFWPLMQGFIAFCLVLIVAFTAGCMHALYQILELLDKIASSEVVRPSLFLQNYESKEE
ncbi:MAG: hypothetical protein DDT19_00072 [Syntrophomonadaceae bacterium]|nr:hypothetical protein [Bacillota bacterium]